MQLGTYNPWVTIKHKLRIHSIKSSILGRIPPFSYQLLDLTFIGNEMLHVNLCATVIVKASESISIQVDRLTGARTRRKLMIGAELGSSH
ncbi:hypothetical protein P8452_03642 [Trifolium repens]|nr:hypothetical protein P8452_03642 [Trifolium repens]